MGMNTLPVAVFVENSVATTTMIERRICIDRLTTVPYRIPTWIRKCGIPWNLSISQHTKIRESPDSWTEKYRIDRWCYRLPWLKRIWRFPLREGGWLTRRTSFLLPPKWGDPIDESMDDRDLEDNISLIYRTPIIPSRRKKKSGHSRGKAKNRNVIRIPAHESVTMFLEHFEVNGHSFR